MILELIFLTITKSIIIPGIFSTLLFAMPGGGELILIVVVVLLLFGGKKIPELMKGIGKGIREFKNAKENITAEIDKGINEPRDVIETKASTS